MSIRATRVCVGLSLAVLLGCSNGGGGSGSGVSCGTKSLYSVWTLPNQSFSFSLANLTLNQNSTLQVTFSGSTKACTGTARMDGSDCGGTYSITGMTWNGQGGSDPGCSSLNETGTWSKSDAGLKFTNSANQSNTYQ
jgi:hypothetical protein